MAPKERQRVGSEKGGETKEKKAAAHRRGQGARGEASKQVLVDREARRCSWRGEHARRQDRGEASQEARKGQESLEARQGRTGKGQRTADSGLRI